MNRHLIQPVKNWVSGGHLGHHTTVRPPVVAVLGDEPFLVDTENGRESCDIFGKGFSLVLPYILNLSSA